MLTEIYTRALKTFNSRDLEGWIAHADENVEVESRFSQFGNTRFRGHRSIRRWWEDLEDAWEFLEVVVEEVREVGPDQTLALVHLNGRGRGSGLEVSEPAAHRVTYREGKWLKLEYVDREAAERELAALD
jgi:ketosteroid isomerase-like protein